MASRATGDFRFRKAAGRAEEQCHPSTTTPADYD
jgi:hypothetical protein